MKILVVDDEKNIRESIARYLTLEGFEVVQASDGINGKTALTQWSFDAAIIDLKMPRMDGLQLLEWIGEQGPVLPVIMISAFGEINDAVHAMKLGALDYIVKPFNPEELTLRLNRLIKDDVQAKNSLHTAKKTETNLIGNSKEMIKIKDVIKKVAKAPSNILITGESGTGKEVTARLIHELSDRSERQFVPVNLGGIPDNLLESELFGYEKGAFTGADYRKIGLFEVASGGTLFLDEIGEMPVLLQVKLLRVLQERKIVRIGSTNQIPVDIKVIAATNRILEDEIVAGRFREDLYYRLNVVKIHLPPLRERLEDIAEITGFFIEKYNERFKKKIKTISSAAINKLSAYSFPGNIRELENIIERAFIFCDTDTISENELMLPDSGTKKLPLAQSVTVKDVERDAIVRALEKWNENRTKAALELGISRRTLINKIREYQL
ncbi:MAG: sigma-54-dependent Fis family transcriptional regulator [Spirochaetes bacterium GWF1_31_7]|nr:MAG: sigma-54-dependent Fis family transcriptional regulator [Spirochaetes bacterium GWE1_32_154]OHD48771.1 MAG: sigma-54-dependent Fis family transcriptional regulator [Spirochaetes bacterium GWE2_31_10]OHD52834.1 MAG: sigma-54-dependent Fis family transcriptional regulator [Spirochaetes bacterium GWF1_31_7]OHD81491.1 MAG: sigma-54-dependent Fis family transcriptional regulator [Spirochaetes bacterium RIFOXYB1_FULL_32_8]HBD95188.1 sigma-54-dependent Fis family transcriptional regulator [Spi